MLRHILRLCLLPQYHRASALADLAAAAPAPHLIPPSSLALLIPAAQSLTADLNPAHRRGRAFGLLHLTGAVGALLGTLLGTNLGHTRPLGVEGWRCAFAAVTAASWAIGVGVLALASDPRTAAARLVGQWRLLGEGICRSRLVRAATARPPHLQCPPQHVVDGILLNHQSAFHACMPLVSAAGPARPRAAHGEPGMVQRERWPALCAHPPS